MIGPTFAAEIEAAGLAGLPFSWSSEGVLFGSAMSEADRAHVQAVIDAHDPTAASVLPVPDGPTLSDWRVALIRMGRFAEVEAAVIAARDSGTPEGLIAWQRFEYANNVYRGELLVLAPLFGFSPAEIDDSLRMAARPLG